MRCFVTRHAHIRYRKRCPNVSINEALCDVYSLSDYVYEVVESSGAKYPQHHVLCHKKLKILLAFNWDMDTLITVNPSTLSKFKRRRSQCWKEVFDVVE